MVPIIHRVFSTALIIYAIHAFAEVLFPPFNLLTLFYQDDAILIIIFKLLHDTNFVFEEKEKKIVHFLQFSFFQASSPERSRPAVSASIWTFCRVPCCSKTIRIAFLSFKISLISSLNQTFHWLYVTYLAMLSTVIIRILRICHKFLICTPQSVPAVALKWCTYFACHISNECRLIGEIVLCVWNFPLERPIA